VRLESDASGGELHVRADVVGDDGRAQTFRRLRVLVAGPDGFSRDLPLEAVGAGRYAANLPLSRPGTYVATAKDESDGSAVGTTAAVLDRGEELRPTGSDRALLVRIASMTGGKMRDTLAGAFDDRTAQRFSYAPLAQWLSLLAGIALVLAVAARKMALPERFTAAFGASLRPVLAARRQNVGSLRRTVAGGACADGFSFAHRRARQRGLARQRAGGSASAGHQATPHIRRGSRQEAPRAPLIQ
jgi:hypothetical protein